MRKFTIQIYGSKCLFIESFSESNDGHVVITFSPYPCVVSIRDGYDIHSFLFTLFPSGTMINEVY